MADTIKKPIPVGEKGRALVIINPVAGDGRSLRIMPHIIRTLTEGGYVTTALTTTAQGDGKAYVLRYGEGCSLVVCSGGDGTANEVISGLMELPEDKRPRFGYIPAGSTNDFAATLGIPKQTQEAVRMIGEEYAVPIDIGRFNDRYYAYVCAFGAFTELSYSTPQAAKNIFGPFAYYARSLESMRNIAPIRARFIINGEEIVDDFAFCSISNANIIGGVMRLKKDLVDLNDGEFEIILITYPEDAIGFTKILNAITSGEMSCEYMRIYRAAEVDITILEEEPVDFSLDGEAEKGIRHAHIVNVHSGIRTIVKKPVRKKSLFEPKGAATKE